MSPDKKVLCVIPARYGSTRLPAKPLALIRNVPLIVWVYRNAVASRAFDNVVVATDDQRIVEAVEHYNGIAVMTSELHQRGTDRVFEVVEKIPCSHVINLQGDEPDIPHQLLRDFSEATQELDDNSLLTIVSHATIKERDNPNTVKVVLNVAHEALYFSRAPIPFDRDEPGRTFFRHCGIYGFTAASIRRFCQFPAGTLECRESLEQLRALEYGMRIKCLIREFRAIGIDTPQDLEAFRNHVETRNG